MMTEILNTITQAWSDLILLLTAFVLLLGLAFDWLFTGPLRWVAIPLVAFSLHVLVTLIFFAAVMAFQLARDKGKLTPELEAFAVKFLLPVGLVLDLLLNVVWGTIIFLRLPQDWLLSMRLARYKQEWLDMVDAAPAYTTLKAPWRSTLAMWLCANFLDPLETHPSGCHCRV
jgi:hypothetical protein